MFLKKVISNMTAMIHQFPIHSGFSSIQSFLFILQYFPDNIGKLLLLFTKKESKKLLKTPI
jgi:hypothetical protein